MRCKVTSMAALFVQPNDRVFQPQHPERGYGLVKLVEESVLSDERICQVAFEWVPGLVAVAETELRRVAKLEGGEKIAAEEVGGFDELRRRLSAALVMAENSQTAAFIRSFAMPLPHQAYLLEKILSQRRLGHVIADDVGMGKTIEAGLIIATFRQRNPQCRVLVLCPAGLVLQWQDEMDEHFGLIFSIAGRDFRVDRKANWDSHSLVLASLDTLKQERLREVLKDAPPFDLVVCDEAHRLTARREFLTDELYRTQNYRFVEWLAQERIVSWEPSADGSPRSPRLLLMSATPHQGDDLRFAYLLQLVRPDQVEAEAVMQADSPLSDPSVLEVCLTRTAKRRAVDWSGKPIFLGHETHTLDVPLSVSEKNALQRLAQYVQSEMVFKESKGNALVRALAMHTFQKIAASSWEALRAALAARLRKSGGLASASTGEDSESASDGDEFDFLGGNEERNALSDLLQSLNDLSKDSKWDTFEDLIVPGNGFRASGERLLIFTHYRVTQQWLAERLRERGERVMLIHGGLSLDERKKQREDFEADGTVLISTEAGSEGANLHRKCHLMVNYDLPWNPMRLLQRIGRLNRYGQTHKVRVANLKAPESWDARVSTKIEAKLSAVQASMGLVADEDYRNMIMGSVHESIDVVKVMESCRWGADEQAMDEAIDEAMQKVMGRKSALNQLVNESLGMPENYGKGSPSLDADDFRQAFAWAAAAHEIVLRETRTSDNQYLKGVHHFTLPEAFRGGLRPTRECYLVFDRERFAEVRGTSLGRARGQEIRPMLAGFGDAVTDWFFRRALEASGTSGIYQMALPQGAGLDEAWWIIFSARWKVARDWSGPDLLVACATKDHGSLLRVISAKELSQALLSSNQPKWVIQADFVLPSLEDSRNQCRNELRKVFGTSNPPQTLSMTPLCLIRLTRRPEAVG